MLPDNSVPTPAELEFLKFTRQTSAATLYDSLHTTLLICIGNYLDGTDKETPATAPALEAWCFQLELMKKMHDVRLVEE